MQSVSNEDEWSRCEIEVEARCASLDTNGRAVASPHSITTLSESGKELVRKLACQCRPRCTVRSCKHVEFLKGKGKGKATASGSRGLGLPRFHGILHMRVAK
jgi:hypothetical protein